MPDNTCVFEKVEATIKVRGNKEASSVIKRTQFPLMLASLTKPVINFDLMKQKQFHNGQMYVVLSEGTSLDRLYLTGAYNPSVIRADPRTFHEYERMRQECILYLPYYAGLSDDSIKVILLNTRVFIHAVDINGDPILLCSDILCLTETAFAWSKYLR